jgi:hypothetical protein
VTESKVVNFRSFKPRNNLPSARKRGESNLVCAFARTYADQNEGVGKKEFPVSGFGIADLIWASSDGSTIIAFEMKLTDWKKAIGQAYRYRYFSNQAYVVLPATSAVEQNQHVFEAANIGLILYDDKNHLIYEKVTPLFLSPKNPELSKIVLKKLFGNL